MPAVLFRVRWPDGDIEACYSPSTIVETFFQGGRAYTLADFLETARNALTAASERVRQRYGGAGCSRALSQLAAIEARAQRYTADGAPVHIESFERL